MTYEKIIKDIHKGKMKVSKVNYIDPNAQKLLNTKYKDQISKLKKSKI